MKILKHKWEEETRQTEGIFKYINWENMQATPILTTNGTNYYYWIDGRWMPLDR